jgi:glycosyltransferase involved in cell wall biosynthesis
MSAKISVILPVFNACTFLEMAINSILQQSYGDFDLILINDCSTDGSSEIIQKFAKIDERIQVITNIENKGLIFSLNAGLALAKGKYIARMDADDIAHTTRFQKQADFLDQYPEIYLIGSDAYMIDINGNILGNQLSIKGFENISKELWLKSTFIHPSIMFRNTQEFWYREKAIYCEDYDLYLQLLVQGKKMDNLNEKLLYYRITNTSITRTKNFHMKLIGKKIREIHQKKFHQNLDVYDEFNPNEILSLRPPVNNERSSEESNIASLLAIPNKLLTRKYCYEYFNKYGILNRMIIYYLLSYIPAQTILYLKNKLGR